MSKLNHPSQKIKVAENIIKTPHLQKNVLMAKYHIFFYLNITSFLYSDYISENSFFLSTVIVNKLSRYEPMLSISIDHLTVTILYAIDLFLVKLMPFKNIIIVFNRTCSVKVANYISELIIFLNITNIYTKLTSIKCFQPFHFHNIEDYL